MKKYFYALFALGSFISCQQEASSDQDHSQALDLNKTLPGTWELININVKVNTFENMDSNFVQEIKEEDWEKIFYVKPVRTFYELDHKYRRAHFDLRDSLMSESRGMWNVFNDTLMMIEPDATYQYIVSQQSNGLLRVFTLLDWDSDGQEDDEYAGLMRYISRTTD
ncbi:MAG: hypothetical protein R2828_00125 [Saprospiraceae bacterium]